MANAPHIEAALFKGLANGTVYSQADLTIEIDDRERPAKENRPRNKGIDRLHWARLVDDDAAITEIWATGYASLEAPPLQIQFCGIVFDEAHVSGLIDTMGIAPSKKTFSHTGRPSKDWWSDLAVELADLFYRDGLPPGEGHAGAETVISKLQSRLSLAGHEAPSARSIRDTVRKALIKVRGN